MVTTIDWENLTAFSDMDVSALNGAQRRVQLKFECMEKGKKLFPGFYRHDFVSIIGTKLS